MHTSPTDRSLLRLAHSVLWPGFTGTTPPDWLHRGLENGLAGTVYFAHNIDQGDPEQVSGLSAAIHRLAPHALIGVDEEGGIVTRLQASTGSSVPGNAVLGRVDDLAATERTAAWIGRLVARAGIDIDLAPDADVNCNPANPVIGVRSFHADGAVVARHTAASVRGLQSAGVAACAKHFPGHGDTTSDSHREPATAQVDLETLRGIHLPPFVAAIEAGVKAIMSAHIRVPQLGELPATINPRSLGLLRELGFDGVIVTDALDMGAIASTIGTGAGAVAALNAGADLLCIGNPANTTDPDGARRDERSFQEPLQAVYAALRSGELPTARVEAAAERLATLAAWRAAQPAPDAPKHHPDAFDGALLARAAAAVHGAVQLAPGPILVIDGRSGHNLAAGEAADFFTRALRERRTVSRMPVGAVTAAPTAAAGAAAAAAADFTGEVVLVVDQPQSSPFETAVAAAVLAARPDTVLLHTGWPGQTRPAAERSIIIYGATPGGAEAAARLLVGA